MKDNQMEELSEDYFKRHHYLLFNEEMVITKLNSFLGNKGHIVWEMDLSGKVGKATFYVNGNTELRDNYKVGEVVNLTIGDDDMCCNNRMGLSKVSSYKIKFCCDEEYSIPTTFKMTFYKKIRSDDLNLTYDRLYSIRML